MQRNYLSCNGFDFSMVNKSVTVNVLSSFVFVYSGEVSLLPVTHPWLESNKILKEERKIGRLNSECGCDATGVETLSWS